MALDLDDAVHDWMLEHPACRPVLKEFGIDTSCGGKSLGFTCRERGLDPDAVLARLRDRIRRDEAAL